MHRFGTLVVTVALLAPLPVLAAPPKSVPAPAALRLAYTPEDGEEVPPETPAPAAPVAPAAPQSYAPKPPPEIRASGAILVDAHTGQVLFEHNAHARRAPASTTKIMTATLILEHGHLDDVVTISKRAATTPYGSLHLRPGEKLTLGDILYGILLRSANDGCVAAAEHIAGSEAAFAQLMNKKAREIGATDTHFVTCNGLYDPNHYTTAADLAKIVCYAIRNPAFNAYTSTTEHTIQRSIAKQDSVIRNRNRFLKRYPGADGIKTGYVRQSGFCLVAAATHPDQGNPWRLIAVVLNSPDTIGESSALLDYGFSQFKPIFAAHSGETVSRLPVRWGAPGKIGAVVSDDLFAVFPRSAHPTVTRELNARPLRAPLKRSQQIGTLTAVYDGKTRITAPLVTAVPVRKDWAGIIGRTCAVATGLMLFGLGPLYARAFTKGSRRRRRRVTTRRRSADPVEPGRRERVGGVGAWE